MTPYALIWKICITRHIWYNKVIKNLGWWVGEGRAPNLAVFASLQNTRPRRAALPASDWPRVKIRLLNVSLIFSALFQHALLQSNLQVKTNYLPTTI